MKFIPRYRCPCQVLFTTFNFPQLSHSELDETFQVRFLQSCIAFGHFFRKISILSLFFFPNRKKKKKVDQKDNCCILKESLPPKVFDIVSFLSQCKWRETKRVCTWERVHLFCGFLNKNISGSRCGQFLLNIIMVCSGPRFHKSLLVTTMKTNEKELYDLE